MPGVFLNLLDYNPLSLWGLSLESLLVLDCLDCLELRMVEAFSSLVTFAIELLNVSSTWNLDFLSLIRLSSSFDLLLRLSLTCLLPVIGLGLTIWLYHSNQLY